MSDQIHLAEELGLQSVSPELRAEILQNAERSIYKRVLLNVLQTLQEQEKNELLTILEAEEDGNGFSNEAVLQFLRDHISDFDEMVQHEITTFKEEGMQFYKAMVSDEA